MIKRAFRNIRDGGVGNYCLSLLFLVLGLLISNQAWQSQGTPGLLIGLAVTTALLVWSSRGLRERIRVNRAIQEVKAGVVPPMPEKEFADRERAMLSARWIFSDKQILDDLRPFTEMWQHELIEDLVSELVFVRAFLVDLGVQALAQHEKKDPQSMLDFVSECIILEGVKSGRYSQDGWNEFFDGFSIRNQHYARVLNETGLDKKVRALTKVIIVLCDQEEVPSRVIPTEMLTGELLLHGFYKPHSPYSKWSTGIESAIGNWWINQVPEILQGS